MERTPIPIFWWGSGERSRLSEMRAGLDKARAGETGASIDSNNGENEFEIPKSSELSHFRCRRSLNLRYDPAAQA